MLAIDNLLISEDIIEKDFVCNLSSCKGACCVAGDSGAPLEVDELDILKQEFNNYKEYLTENGLQAIEKSGFYLYDEAGKQQGVNPEIVKLLPQTKKVMDEVQIQMRVFLPMINEAANILADGIVTSASQVDLGVVYGIGFPPFKGGLMKYADSEGLDRILDSIKNFAETISKERYKPSDYLVNLVNQKKKFYDI